MALKIKIVFYLLNLIDWKYFQDKALYFQDLKKGKRLEGKEKKRRNSNQITLSHIRWDLDSLALISAPLNIYNEANKSKWQQTEASFPVALLLIFALQNICIPFTPPLFLRSPCLFLIFPIFPQRATTSLWPDDGKEFSNQVSGTWARFALSSLNPSPSYPLAPSKWQRSVFDVLPLASIIL